MKECLQTQGDIKPAIKGDKHCCIIIIVNRDAIAEAGNLFHAMTEKGNYSLALRQKCNQSNLRICCTRTETDSFTNGQKVLSYNDRNRQCLFCSDKKR